MARLLTGKEVAASLKEKALALRLSLNEKGVAPGLGIIRVGAQPDDLYYESNLKRNCEASGVVCFVMELPFDASQDAVERAVTAFSNDNAVHGILMFSPLPKHLNEEKIRALINPAKDVDCLTKAQQAEVFNNNPNCFAPSTAAAVMEILKYYDIPLKGKKVAMVGRSMVVGKPLAMLLLGEHATVTICHSRTADLPAETKAADIVVAAIGRAKMFNADYFRAGQIVIDVGINSDPDREGKICGDVDTASVAEIVDAITPVPGGVGSITSALTVYNTVIAAEKAFKAGVKIV